MVMRSERQASTLTPIKRFTIICSVNAILRKCNRKTKRETFVALVKDILWIMITTSCLPSKVKNLEEFFLQKKNVSEKSKVIFFSHLLIERRYLFVVFVAVHDQAHQAFDVLLIASLLRDSFGEAFTPIRKTMSSPARIVN